MDYGTGILRIYCSEIIDSGPKGSKSIYPNKFYIVNEASAATSEGINLNAAKIKDQESIFVELHLTEEQRAKAIAISATPGGDGSAILLNVFSRGIIDMAGNANGDDHVNSTAVASVHVTEKPDATKPMIKQVYIFHGDGTILIECTETIDSTPATQIDLTKFYISLMYILYFLMCYFKF